MERIALDYDQGLAGQMLRYGVTGVALAALYALVYWAVAVLLSVQPQFANGAGFSAALVAGYILHSRWSFRGYGRRDGGWSWGRFLVVNFAGYLLNCLWVWLIVDRLHRPIELSIALIITITPAFTFLLNRRWTFA